jgi:hypothetical protein
MKKYNEWKRERLVNENEDNSNWNSLRYLFGGNREVAPSPMIQALKSKIEQMKDKFARDNGSVSFEQLPIDSVHEFAKDMVATVIKSVYGNSVGAGRAIDVPKIGRLESPADSSPPMSDNIPQL